MTEDRIALQELIEKSTYVDFTRPMVRFATQLIMELEVESLRGYGEHSL